MFSKSGIWVLASALALASPAWAGSPPAAPSQGQPVVGARFKQARAALLRNRLGLDEKRAGEVERVLDKYGPERRRLRETIRSSTQTINDLLRSQSNDQASYQRAIDTLAEAVTKLDGLRQQERAELSKLLTPKQQAQLLQVMLRARRNARRARDHAEDADGGVMP